MGCDIHFHTEVKIDGAWLHHSESRLNRNYKVFAKMANVRNQYEINPISMPKGLPDDITLITRMANDRLDTAGHSHSWFGLDEIADLHEWLDSEIGWEYAHKYIPYFSGNHLDGLKKYPEDWQWAKIEDARYVFFFDN